MYLGSHATPEVGVKGTGLQHGSHQSLILSHQQCQHLWICQQIVTVCKLQCHVKKQNISYSLYIFENSFLLTCI